METTHSHKDLIVWQKAIDLTVAVYKLTETFPKSELYGFTSQMRRASASIPANIAEGRRRPSRKEYAHFLGIAFASGAELETHIEIAKKLKFTGLENYVEVEKLLDEVMRMLNRMTSNLRT